jgi:hypothetical protein
MMSKKTRFNVEYMTAQGGALANVITDTETGVQYLLAIFPSVGSGLTVLVDQDGKPLLHK